MKVTGVSAATILVLAIASPSHAQGIEVFGGYSANADYVQNRPAIRRSTGGCCIVTTWTMRASRTDASENWPTSTQLPLGGMHSVSGRLYACGASCGASPSTRRSTSALAGQAERNSTDSCTLAGTCALVIGTNPSFGK